MLANPLKVFGLAVLSFGGVLLLAFFADIEHLPALDLQGIASMLYGGIADRAGAAGRRGGDSRSLLGLHRQSHPGGALARCSERPVVPSSMSAEGQVLKWLARFLTDGFAALADKSSRPASRFVPSAPTWRWRSSSSGASCSLSR